VTVTVISFVYKARPEILLGALESRPIGNHSVRNVVITFSITALLTGGIVSWFASKDPDGLEWAITKVTGKNELDSSKQGLHSALATIQEATAFLPDYSFRKPAVAKNEEAKPEALQTHQSVLPDPKSEEKKPEQPKNPIGTSVAGLVGGTITLGIALLIGFILKRKNQIV
jgi:cobalt/nickel transport system permease protein